MSSSLRRDRLVVFRLTQEEYRMLQAACAAAGRRSVSDFTRAELLSIVQSDSVDASVRDKLLEMDRKLDRLLESQTSTSRRTGKDRLRLEAVVNH
jgi:hypothetical protein